MGWLQTALQYCTAAGFLANHKARWQVMTHCMAFYLVRKQGCLLVSRGSVNLVFCFKNASLPGTRAKDYNPTPSFLTNQMPFTGTRYWRVPKKHNSTGAHYWKTSIASSLINYSLSLNVSKLRHMTQHIDTVGIGYLYRVRRVYCFQSECLCLPDLQWDKRILELEADLANIINSHK